MQGSDQLFFVPPHNEIYHLIARPSRMGLEYVTLTNVSENELRGLRSFEEVAHKPVQKYVVYTGETRQQFSKSEKAFPYREFLEEVVPGM